MRKFRLLTAVPVLGLLLAAPFAVRAATTLAVPAGKPDCAFRTRIEELRAIQADGTLNYIDAIRAQLEVRKSVLRSAINCALMDLFATEQKLSAVPGAYQSSGINQNLQKQLGDTYDFYSAELKLVDGLGIKGTEDVAAEVASWRTGVYAPAAAETDNFLLWIKNQPLFGRTEARLAQIKPLVLSLTLLPGNDLDTAWNEAKSAWTSAQNQNSAAESALQSADPAAGDLIQSSLQSLSDIYKNLFSISDQMKKVVP